MSEVSTSSSDSGGESLSSDEEEDRAYEDMIVDESDICDSDDDADTSAKAKDEVRSHPEGFAKLDARLDMVTQTIEKQGEILELLLNQQSEFRKQLDVVLKSNP